MKKKLLIIEDDQTLNEMYSIKFEKEWFDVSPAYDWLEWLTKISTFNPDVILLDIMMPWMNGFETLETIKEQSSSNCKIVMFTNIVDKDKIEKAMKMWADDYLIKADTTPKNAVEKINKLFENNSNNNDSSNNSNNISINYLKEWINNFKIKNPDWGEDISIDINIKK